MTRPNVLFILSDQHNAKLTGYAGHGVVQTPALDRLAAEGVVFRNAVCNNTICTPSRICFLSGQYCHNHGYYGLSGPHPGPLPSMLSHFREHGYRTGAIGKMHCPDYWIEDQADVFLEAANSSIGGSPEYEAYLRSHGLLHLRDDRRYPEHPAMSLDARPSSLPYEDTVDAWIGRESMAFMKACADADSPFFLHMSFPHPHQVYAPAQEFWDLYAESAIELPPNADWSLEGKAPHLRSMAASFRTGDWTLFEPRTHEAGRLRKLRGYYGVISQVDRAIGEVVDWMQHAGLLENTIIVYSSDHGEYATEHGIMEKAPGICSDAVTRIPMVWRVPERSGSSRSTDGAPRGRTEEALMESVDVSATLCDLCGLAPMRSSDGQSHAPLVATAGRQSAPVARDVAVTEAPWSKAVIDGRYRLVFYPREMFGDEYPDGFGELYDLAEDPWEMRNLYFDTAHAETVRGLRDALLEHLVMTQRPVTVLPGYRDPDGSATHRSGNDLGLGGTIPPGELARRSREALPLRNYL